MNTRGLICEVLTEHCEWLNNAHKDRAKHKIMERTIPYQRYIGAMEELNAVSKDLGYRCQCKEVFAKGKKHTEKNHIGHRMVKR
jgi:predicted SprT family Zn-dependent metalloprotease